MFLPCAITVGVTCYWHYYFARIFSIEEKNSQAVNFQFSKSSKAKFLCVLLTVYRLGSKIFLALVHSILCWKAWDRNKLCTVQERWKYRNSSSCFGRQSCHRHWPTEKNVDGLNFYLMAVYRHSHISQLNLIQQRRQQVLRA